MRNKKAKRIEKTKTMIEREKELDKQQLVLEIQKLQVV